MKYLIKINSCASRVVTLFICFIRFATVKLQWSNPPSRLISTSYADLQCRVRNARVSEVFAFRGLNYCDSLRATWTWIVNSFRKFTKIRTRGHVTRTWPPLQDPRFRHLAISQTALSSSSPRSPPNSPARRDLLTVLLIIQNRYHTKFPEKIHKNNDKN